MLVPLSCSRHLSSGHVSVIRGICLLKAGYCALNDGLLFGFCSRSVVLSPGTQLPTHLCPCLPEYSHQSTQQLFESRWTFTPSRAAVRTGDGLASCKLWLETLTFCKMTGPTGWQTVDDWRTCCALTTTLEGHTLHFPSIKQPQKVSHFRIRTITQGK